jgi:hypothetical protein
MSEELDQKNLTFELKHYQLNDIEEELRKRGLIE